MSPKAAAAKSDLPQGLELVDEGARIVSLTFGIKLFTDKVFSKIPDAVLGVYDRFLKLCPPDRFRFYATENMSQHKPVAKKTFDMLQVWLKPGAPKREYVSIELHDGETMAAAPRSIIKVLGAEPGSVPHEEKSANLISLAIPAEEAAGRADELLAFTKELCETFPCQSGYAGYSFECSRYDQRKSQTHAWQKASRHQGIEISMPVKDAIAAGHNALKGVNWLTMVCDAFVKKAGGEAKIRKALSKGVEAIPIKAGLMLKAGPVPKTGDTNRKEFLPEYREVYKALEPLIETAVGQSKSISIAAPDFVEKSEAWYRRFANA